MGHRFHDICRATKLAGERVEIAGPIENSRHAPPRIGIRDRLLDLAESDIAWLAPKLVDRREHCAGFCGLYSNIRQDCGEKSPVGYPGTDIGCFQTDASHDVDRKRQQLGVGNERGLANDVRVELEVLAQPSLLLAFVAKQLGHRKPANGLAQGVRLCRHHTCQRRRHFGTQRNVAVTFVLEIVKLSDDLFAALARVELEGLQRRSVVLDETVFPRDVTPHRHEIIAGGQLFRIKVSKSGQRPL